MNFRNKLAITSCVVTALVATQIYAAPAESIGLLDAVRLTLENNPQFRTYQLRSDAITGELQTADQKPAIRINTEVENVFGTGDLNWFQGTEISFSLSQIIEFGDKRFLRVNAVSQRQNLLLAQQRILELDLLSQTSSRYIELATAEAMQQLQARATQLAREISAVVTDRVVAGRAPEADRARAAAALALASLAEESAGYTIQAAKFKLSSLWGLLEPDFTETEANLLQVEELTDINILLQKLDQNPAIEIFASTSRLREAELREAKSQRSADIQIGAGIRHLAELNDTALVFQASMPLSSKRRARGAITTAQANLLRVDSEKESALLRMKAQLLSLGQQRELAVNEFTTLQSLVIPQLENALNATRLAFEGGRYSYLEMNAAQNQLLNSELARIQAASRAHLLQVEIERLSGESYTGLNSPNREASDAFSGGISE